MHSQKHDKYDPVSYWDAKARNSSGDPVRAVCMDDPVENQCIERIQRRLLNSALRTIASHGASAGLPALDFGCGTGRWVSLLQKAGYQYFGIDISPEIISMARTKFPAANLELLEGERLPYPDNHFALVISVAVIHHNVYDKQNTIMAELERVLRPGGHLILFEGIGPQSRLGAVEYPRQFSDWIHHLESTGLRHIKSRSARYWILRSIYIDFVAERLSRFGLAPAIIPRVATRLDVWLDPYLGTFLPWWYVTRSLIVCAKPISTSK